MPFTPNSNGFNVPKEFQPQQVATPVTPTAPVTPVAPTATAVKKGATAHDKFKAEGYKLLSGQTAEENAIQGKLAPSLHFQYLLGLGSRLVQRAVRASEIGAESANYSKTNPPRVNCSMTVGAAFISDYDIEVPHLKDVRFTVDKLNGAINPDEIEYVQVKKGELFYLTVTEAVLLLISLPYAGKFAYQDNPYGGYLQVSSGSSDNGQASKKIPTPSLNLVGTAIKSTIVDIDNFTRDEKTKKIIGEVTLKEGKGYDRFAPLLERSKSAPRAAHPTAKKDDKVREAIAAGLRQALGYHNYKLPEGFDPNAVPSE